MIVTGGENVYPAEVEAVLDAHPGVGSSCVIGLPDDDLGQRLHAIVQADPAIESSLRAHLAASLARYKIPRSLEFVSEPLRDDAGKLRRSQKRAERMAMVECTGNAERLGTRAPTGRGACQWPR